MNGQILVERQTTWEEYFNMFDVLDKGYLDKEDFMELWNGLSDYKKELLGVDKLQLMECFDILDGDCNGL